MQTHPLEQVLATRIRPGRAIEDAPALALVSWDGSRPRLATEARIAHDGISLHVAFRGALDALHADPALPRDTSVDGLWRLDVFELFVSDREEGTPYREIEVTPLAQWLALSFDAPRARSPRGWTPRIEVEARLRAREVEARLTVPLADLATGPIQPGAPWRVGLFRVHGSEPGREHLALGPGRTPAPDFHRPATWAKLGFEP